MPRWLHLRLESGGRDDETEMGFLRQATLHGFVVGVGGGVVVDFESCGVQGCCDLVCGQSGKEREKGRKGADFEAHAVFYGYGGHG